MSSHSTAGGRPDDEGAYLEVGGKVRRGRCPNGGKLQKGSTSSQNQPQSLQLVMPVPTYQLVPVGIIDSHAAVSSSGAKQDGREQSFALRQHLQQQHMQNQQQHMHILKRLEHALAGSSAQRPPQFMRVCRMTANEGRELGAERHGGAKEDTHREDSHCNASNQTRGQRGPLGETPAQPERPPTSSKSSRNTRRPHRGSGSERLLIGTPSVSISGASAGQCATGSGLGPAGGKDTQGPAGGVPRLRFSQMGAQNRERSLTSRDREHSFNAERSSNILPLITHRRFPAKGPSDGGQQRQNTANASLFDEDMLDRHHALRNSNEEPDAPPLLNFQFSPQHAQWCWRGADQLHADSKAVYLEFKSLSLRELAERRREVRARCSASACDSICPISSICHLAPAAADPVTSVPL
jgi:hypothetical protein